MAVGKAISGNTQKNNGGVVAFATSASGPVTSVLGKSLLNTKSLGSNLPVSSGVAGTANHGVTATNDTYPVPSSNPNFIIRQTWPFAQIALLRGRAFTTSINTRTTRKIRTVTGWDYVTGAAEGVSTTDVDFSRDDAAPATNNGEFVFIPAGGRLPTQAGGDAKYYTYVKTY